MDKLCALNVRILQRLQIPNNREFACCLSGWVQSTGIYRPRHSREMSQCYASRPHCRLREGPRDGNPSRYEATTSVSQPFVQQHLLPEVLPNNNYFSTLNVCCLFLLLIASAESVIFFVGI